MARNIGTFRTKTRHKFKKNVKERGKICVTKFFQEFNEGDKVSLTVEPACQKGMYFPRFMGRTGIVKGKRKDCYEVEVEDKDKTKLLIVHPVHLKPAK